MNKSPALTWGELANLYDRHNSGRRARTLPMNVVFDWAERRTDLFHRDPKEETLHLLEEAK